MKKFSLVLIALIGVVAVYLSLPLTSVAILTVTLLDQNDRKITTNAVATYFDGGGSPIIKITPATKGSWDNNLHWWSHSSHSTSNMRPVDAMRATSVKIKAANCDEVKLTVNLERSYESFSIFPHGGGAAYFIYRFDRNVVLQCH